MRVPHRLIAVAAVAALALGALAPATHAAEPEAAPSVRAPETPPAAACTGEAATDALEAACGLRLTAPTTTFVWPHAATPIDLAFAGGRLAFRGTPPAEGARPVDYLTVWEHNETTGGWRAWSATVGGAFHTLREFQPGGHYTIAARAPLDLSLAPLRPSSLAGRRVVSIYGHPGVAVMGTLGTYPSAAAAAAGAEAIAAQYRALDEAAGRTTEVVGALHLIVSVALADPGADGTYLGRMTLEDIAPWVEATRARGQLLFLDVQVGWADPLTEVRRLEPLLREPHVHLALDPEFATKGEDEPPGGAIGFLTAEQVNAVQRFLFEVGARAGVPSKVLVVHQFRDDMLVEPERIESVPGVDLVIDMDGWGPPGQKLLGYEAYALAPYAEHPGFKLFYRWDAPLMTPAEVMALATPPTYVIYQ
ncbi:MAG: hypothetical protein AB7G21_10310 [Dehalococcoidia bacterium]